MRCLFIDNDDYDDDDNVFLTKEQSVITKILRSFKGEFMQTHYNIIRYRIDLYFYDYKLAIKIDGNGHSDKSINYELKKAKK